MHMKFVRAVSSLLILLLLISVSIIHGIASQSSTASIYLQWYIYSNPSPLDDRPFAVCIIGDFIYVVGYDAMKMNSEFRIEKRFKADGSLVKVWVYNPTFRDDILFDCLAMNTTIYVTGVEGVISFPNILEGGTTVIVALDNDLNMIRYVRLNVSGLATSITSDGIYIYVGGYYFQGSDRGWFIGKLDKKLNLVKLKLYNPSEFGDYIYQIKYDRYSNLIWITGIYKEVYAAVAYVDTELSKDPVMILGTQIMGSALSIEFDDYGNKYVSTYGTMGNKFVGLLKLDSGNRVVATLNSYYGSKIVWAWNLLYAIKSDTAISVTVFDQSLNVATSYVINSSTMCGTYFMMASAVFDEKNLYFASSLCPSGDSGWGIYSVKLLIQIRVLTATTTLTQTLMKQIPVTIYINFTATQTMVQLALTTTYITVTWTQTHQTFTTPPQIYATYTTQVVTTTLQTRETITKLETIEKPYTLTYTTTMLQPTTITVTYRETIKETVTVSPNIVTQKQSGGVAQAQILIVAIAIMMFIAILILYKEIKLEFDNHVWLLLHPEVKDSNSFEES